MKNIRNFNYSYFLQKIADPRYFRYIFLILSTIGNLNNLWCQYTQNKIVLYRIHSEGKAGYINKEGKIIVEPKYDQVPHYLAGTVFWAKQNGKYFLLNTKGINVAKEEFEEVKEMEVYDKWIFKKNEKWGGIDSSGITKIPFIFDFIDYFSGGFALAQFKGQKGFIDEKGTFTLFDENYVFENIGEGFFSAKKNHLIGLYSAAAKKFILKPQFSQVSRVRYNQLILLIPKPYSYAIYNCAENKFIVKSKLYQNIWMSFTNLNKNYFIGDELLYTQEEDSVYFAFRHLNSGSTKNIYCLLNYNGKEIATLDTNHIYNSDALFFGGLSAFNYGRNKGMIDKSGKTIVKPEYDMVMYCSDGLIPVQKNNKWGFLDTKSNIVVPFEFENYGFFVNGLAYVSKIEEGIKKNGYINKKGAWVWVQAK